MSVKQFHQHKHEFSLIGVESQLLESPEQNQESILILDEI
jgi:hypothetical protein